MRYATFANNGPLFSVTKESRPVETARSRGATVKATTLSLFPRNLSRFSPLQLQLLQLQLQLQRRLYHPFLPSVLHLSTCLHQLVILRRLIPSHRSLTLTYHPYLVPTGILLLPRAKLLLLLSHQSSSKSTIAHREQFQR